MDAYRCDHMAQAIYEFTWNEYCDWYLELSKPVLTNPESSPAAQRGTRQTLIRVLETLLRLAHPLLPFITEEIWQRIAPLAGVTPDNRPTTETIMLQPYPQFVADRIDTNAMDEIEWVKNFILGVRKIRSSMDIKPGKLLPVLLQNGNETDQSRLDVNLHYLKNLGRIESVTWLDTAQEAPESATALVGEMKILIPMAGLIDKEAEEARLGKEIAKLGNDISRVESKLSNANFVDKAPPAVVDKERQKLSDLNTALQQLTEQLTKITNL
jgi:valyl-tRNA synthetase